MEKVAFDLYAHIVNENAKEEDKKSVEVEATTVDSSEELTTNAEELTTIIVTSPSTTTTTTTTEPPTTTTSTTTTEAPIAKSGRGSLTAGRNSNRFKFQGKASTTTTETPVESSSAKNRFNRPSFGSSRSNSGSRFNSKTTPAAAVVEENVEKSEAPAVSSNKFRSSPTRNRFNLRGSTEKPSEGNDSEGTTPSRLIRPSRPQFSLRNRGRPSSPSSSTEATAVAASETPNAEDQENNGEKSTEKSSIVPRPTSRLNINRPANRANVATSPVNNKIRPSPLNRSRVNANANENGSNNSSDSNNKSTNENESELEATTQNNLNKLKSRPRIQINAESKAKKTTAAPVINRKANPLISKRKFGASTTGKKIK